MSQTSLSSVTYSQSTARHSHSTLPAFPKHPYGIFELIDNIDSLKYQADKIMALLKQDISPYLRLELDSKYSEICDTLLKLEHELELLSL